LQAIALYLSMLPASQASILFPYTTLFRSRRFILSSVSPGDERRGRGRGHPTTDGRTQPAARVIVMGWTYSKPIHDYDPGGRLSPDRKSTRLNSSHVSISYAVFCLKKKKQP